MKNVTISLDEELAQFAKTYAAKRSLSLSAFIAGFLRNIKENEEIRKSSLASFTSRGPLFNSGGRRTWTRDGIYE